MAFRRRARTFAFGVIAALSLCVGLALPIVLSLYSSKIGMDAVEAAPGDAFAITEPVVLSVAPGIQVERGTLAFIDTSGQALTSNSFTATGGPTTSSNLRLFNGTLSIGGDPGKRSTATSPFPLSPYIEALTSGRFETLSLRQSTIHLHNLFEGTVALTDVKAEVSLRRRGQIAVKGTGSLRGRQIQFDVTANLGQAERRGGALSKVPLKIALKGELIDLNFDGRMSVSPEQIELQGQGDAALSSGRGAARWLGSYWPSGPGLRDISVRGQMRVGRQMLAFENAVARMDGNEGTGVVGLKLGSPRPVVSATLAFKAFDARPYLATSEREIGEGFKWSTLAAEVLTVPLGMHLDADLRFSADKINFGTFELGRTAATIALKDGRLLADAADIKFNGGEGGGQVSADFTGFTPRVTLRGRLDQMDLAMLSTNFAGRPLLSGKAGIVADLQGAGNTLRDVLRGLAGKITVRGQSSGKIGIDLRGLANAAAAADASGWPGASKGSTDFETVDLKLVLRDGTILAEATEMKTGDGVWTAVGVVNLNSDRLDVTLSEFAPGTSPQAATAVPRRALSLSGPVSSPRLGKPAAP